MRTIPFNTQKVFISRRKNLAVFLPSVFLTLVTSLIFVVILLLISGVIKLQIGNKKSNIHFYQPSVTHSNQENITLTTTTPSSYPTNLEEQLLFDLRNTYLPALEIKRKHIQLYRLLPSLYKYHMRRSNYTNI